MCCTDKEMAAEGKRVPTDRWFEVSYKPCCIQDTTKTPTETAKQERAAHGSVETGVRCGRCPDRLRDYANMRLVRVVYRAEQHDNRKLKVPICELTCPRCHNDMAMRADIVMMVSANNEVHLNIPLEEPNAV